MSEVWKQIMQNDIQFCSLKENINYQNTYYGFDDQI